MYLVRETYQCKPGMTKEFVNKLSQAVPFMESNDYKNIKIMTGVVSNLWDAVLEFETDSLTNVGDIYKLGDTRILKGYLDSVTKGKREFFWIE